MAELDHSDLQEHMGLFSTSVAAQPVSVPMPQLSAILLALDESNQDATTEALAVALAQRLGCRLHLTCAATDGWNQDNERYLQERQQALAEAGITVASSRAEGTPCDQILQICRDQQCDLIVFCAPYLEDFQALGSESVGSNTDMLIYRAPVPLLIIREPKTEPMQCLQHVWLPLTPNEDSDIATAGWTLPVLAPDGHLEVIGMVDEEAIEFTQHVLGSPIDHDTLNADTLAGLTTPKHAGLLAALQRQSAAAHFDCTVAVHRGKIIPHLVELVNAREGLVAIGGPKQRTSTSYQRMQALVRESRNPVLVV